MNENEDRSFEEKANTLISYLDECEEACINAMMHSLEEGGDFVKPERVRMLIDCAEICGVAKRYFLRGSDYAGDVLDTCSYICEDCAQSCQTFFEDETMNECAQVCQNCANACNDIIENNEELDETTKEKEEE